MIYRLSNIRKKGRKGLEKALLRGVEEPADGSQGEDRKRKTIIEPTGVSSKKD